MSHPDAFSQYPPFPLDVPIAQIKRLSLSRLKDGDDIESEKLFNSCKTTGFFLLDLQGTSEGDELLEITKHVYELANKIFDGSLEEKTKYTSADVTTEGYILNGQDECNPKGRLEIWGLPRDFVLGRRLSFRAPKPFSEKKALLEAFISNGHAIATTVLTVLNSQLHLPAGTLTSMRRLSQRSSDQVRLLKMPRQSEGERKTSLYGHKDFGSVTTLFNILGGLQILPEGKEEVVSNWEYIKPEPGCAIINLGAAMTKWSNGLLKAAMHRVLYPPGEQATYDRFALAYFTRPEDDAVIKRLEGSDVIPELTESETAVTTAEWLYQRTAMAKARDTELKGRP